MGFLNKLNQSNHIYQAIAALLILLMVFGLSGCDGRSIQTTAADNGDIPADKSDVEYIYGIPMDENAGVVSNSTADVYSKPDVKSSRITQVLYNQPVSISSDDNGWAQVKTMNGYTGWMKSKYIDRDISSIYGRSYSHRIIVTSKEKVIREYPAGGATRMIAPMGTELYVINSIDDSYEVCLPGNKTGWLQGSGIIHISVNDVIPVTNAEDFAATALRFKGVSYLMNGMSAAGIDAPGLVYICARINGINLPGTIKGQLASGTEIKPENAMSGDLVFLAGSLEEEEVSCVGVCIGGGNYIYAGRKTGYVAIGEINRENPDGIVVAARRIFN